MRVTLLHEGLCLAGNTSAFRHASAASREHDLQDAVACANVLGECTVRAGTLFSQNVDLAEVVWTPAGPIEDRTAHLRSHMAFAHVPMDLHAVEVLVDRDDQLVSKAPELDYMLYAVEVIAGNANRMQRHHINGRSYLVFALPGPVN